MASSAIESNQNRTIGVNFVCQRCTQPLRLDSSYFFNNDDPLITDVSNTQEFYRPEVSWEKGDPDCFRKYVPPANDNGNSFEMVEECKPHPTHLSQDSILQNISATVRLFDLLSDQSEIDHPLCEECTDSLLDQMDNQLKAAEDDVKSYKELLEMHKNEPVVDCSEELQAELMKLMEDEETLLLELEKTEKEKENVEEEIRSKKEERERLKAENEHFWRRFNDQKQRLMQYEDDIDSCLNQYNYSCSHLKKLTSTNIYNATFHIWHSGHFGTINNFRLGRLTSVTVDWNEINAAWGQTVLLLHSLAKKVNLTFERYKLVPYGNHSFLESLEDKTKELPLYGAGGIRFFWDSKFDLAMVAFLDCLDQFKQQVENLDNRFHLPYKMDKGKIEDTNMKASFSIKIQLNSEEQWTKALKFMLTNLKWGLAWVSSQFKDDC